MAYFQTFECHCIGHHLWSPAHGTPIVPTLVTPSLRLAWSLFNMTWWLQDSEHRRPYEALLLAHTPAAAASADWASLGPPQQLVIAAVPGEHSRKPHLGRLLRQYVPPSTSSLEVRRESFPLDSHPRLCFD